MFCLPRKQPCLLNMCLCDFSSRYSIDKRSDITKAFKIDPNNGTLTVAKALDRETTNWHNVTIEAKETSKVFIWPTYCTYCFVLASLLSDLKKAVKRQCPFFVCLQQSWSKTIIHLSVLSIVLTELLQSIYDTCTQWTPANVFLHYCRAEPFILLCGGVHQSAGHKRQCAQACKRLPAIYLWGDTGRRSMYIMMHWFLWFTVRISVNVDTKSLHTFRYSVFLILKDSQGTIWLLYTMIVHTVHT